MLSAKSGDLLTQHSELSTLKEASPRKTTGETTAQSRDHLGLLPFGPDPVRSRPLHRTRPSSAATAPFARRRPRTFYSIWRGVANSRRASKRHGSRNPCRGACCSRTTSNRSGLLELLAPVGH